MYMYTSDAMRICSQKMNCEDSVFVFVMSKAYVYGHSQVTMKNKKGGKDVRMDVMVMENLLYGRQVSQLYDLKGSTRSRYNADTTGKNKVLLDENLLESMLTTPIFIGNKAKRILERAVWNDTAFLAVSRVFSIHLKH
mgnify:FL=1